MFVLALEGHAQEQRHRGGPQSTQDGPRLLPSGRVGVLQGFEDRLGHAGRRQGIHEAADHADEPFGLGPRALERAAQRLAESGRARIFPRPDEPIQDLGRERHLGLERLALGLPPHGAAQWVQDLRQEPRAAVVVHARHAVGDALRCPPPDSSVSLFQGSGRAADKLGRQVLPAESPESAKDGRELFLHLGLQEHLQGIFEPPGGQLEHPLRLRGLRRLGRHRLRRCRGFRLGNLRLFESRGGGVGPGSHLDRLDAAALEDATPEGRRPLRLGWGLRQVREKDPKVFPGDPAPDGQARQPTVLHEPVEDLDGDAEQTGVRPGRIDDDRSLRHPDRQAGDAREERLGLTLQLVEGKRDQLALRRVQPDVVHRRGQRAQGVADQREGPIVQLRLFLLPPPDGPSFPCGGQEDDGENAHVADPIRLEPILPVRHVVLDPLWRAAENLQKAHDVGFGHSALEGHSANAVVGVHAQEVLRDRDQPDALDRAAVDLERLSLLGEGHSFHTAQ